MKKNPNSPKRKVSWMLMTFLVLFVNHYNLRAQTPCEMRYCHNNTLNISTGYNQNAAGYNTPLSLESNWTLVSVPTGSGVTLPAPSWDIPALFGWANNP